VYCSATHLGSTPLLQLILPAHPLQSRYFGSARWPEIRWVAIRLLSSVHPVLLLASPRVATFLSFARRCLSILALHTVML